MDLSDGPVPVRLLGPAVSTEAVTPPGQPITVVYEAVDAAGNAARRQRFITVTDDCTQHGEFRCRDTLRCSVFRSCSLGLGAALSQAALPASAAGVDGFGSSTILAVTVQTAAVRPPDTIPPTLRISGTGQLFITESGAVGMIDTVFVGSTYVDAGATAEDLVPSGGDEAPATLDLTHAIVVSIKDPGGAVVDAVSTDAPTGTDATGGLPYVVSYDVVDGSGKRAETVFRRVYVVCRPPERECPHGGGASERRACSAGGICGAAMPPLATEAVLGITALAATAPQSAANDGDNGTSVASGGGGEGGVVLVLTAASGSSVTSGATAVVGGGANGVLTTDSGGGGSGIPRLVLNHAPSVAVARGAAYVPCRGDIVDECDPGATATLQATGDLSPQVRACATGVRDPLPFDVVGLQYCNIDTRLPGNYTISFHLIWPSVGELIVYRQVVVEDDCIGERVCADGTCSLDGWCAGENPPDTGDGAGNGGSAAASASAKASTGTGILGRSNGAGQGTGGGDLSTSLRGASRAHTANANTPPRLELATSSVLGRQVSVPRGVPYARCSPGQAPTAALPCEPLASAVDSEDGDLTPMVALCPPADCAKTQCRAHWADRKQPSECGVDTVTGAVGTTYRLQIVVFDSAGDNATAERTIKVVSPCTDDGSPHACEEPSTDGSSASRLVCSSVPCEERQRLLDAAAGVSASSLGWPDSGGSSADVPARPRLFLLPGLHASNLSQAETNQSVFLTYLQPAPWSLAPCAAFTDGLSAAGQLPSSSCAAVANGSAGADLTPEIRTTVEAVCPAGLACSGCTVAALTVGACVPGHYRVNYAVSEGGAGTSSMATTALALDVYVEQLTWQLFQLSLYPGGTAERSRDRAAAEAFAASLAANETARLEALSPILQALGVPRDNVRSVALTAPPVVEASNMGPASGPPPPTAAPPLSGGAAVPPPSSLAVTYIVRVAVNVTTGLLDMYYAQLENLGYELNAETATGDSVGDNGGDPSPVGNQSRRRATLGTTSASAVPGLVSPAVNVKMGPQSKPDARTTSLKHALPKHASLKHGKSMLHGDGIASSVKDATAKTAFGTSAFGTDMTPLGVATTSHDGRLAHRPKGQVLRRGLQQTPQGCVDIPVEGLKGLPSSTAGLAGLASVEATNSSACGGPTPDEFSISLSLLIGAVADLEAQTQAALNDQATVAALVAGLDDKLTATDQAYRTAIVTMATEASQALASAYAKAEQLLALQDATLQLQNANTVAIGAALSLLQATLNEAQAAEARSRLSTAMLLEGLGLGGNDGASGEAENQYAACLFSRGGGASFSFRIESYGVSAATTPAAAAGNDVNGSPSGAAVGGDTAGATRRLRFRRFHAAAVAVAATEAAGDNATDANEKPPAPPQQQQHQQQLLLSRGRALAAIQGGGGGDPGDSDGGGGMVFNGYTLPSGQGFDYSLWEVRDQERLRFAGLGNRVLAGLLLHQERRDIGATTLDRTAVRNTGDCGTSAYPHLVAGCTSSASGAFPSSASSAVASGAEGGSAARSGLGGIGTDPAFSRFSSLYQPSLQPADWYNTTQGSPEVNPAGLPYGFFHEPLERLPPGYPLLFDTRLSAQRAEQAITFVRDGGYLSSTFTKSLRAQLVTYNPDAQAFGYWRVDFSWSDSGVIDAKTYLLGLPAISYGDSVYHLQVSKFLPDFFLVLLVLSYWCMTAYDIVRQLQAQRERGGAQQAGSRAAAGSGGRRSNRVRPGRAGGKGHLDPWDDAFEGVGGSGRPQYTPRMSAKWVVYEVTVCALMAAAVGVFYSYAVRLSVRDDFSARFDVYDADSYAPARFFLLRRRPNADLAQPAGNASAAGVAGSTEAAAATLAGAPGRWREAADSGPLRSAGAMLARLDDMYNTVVLYTFLQGLVLLAIVVRWLHYISFQPRLSILFGTLVTALPDLLHFALVVFTCVIMFGAAAGLVFGSSVARLSNMGSSVTLMLQYVLLYDDGGVFRRLLDNTVIKSGLEWALAGLLYVLGPIFFLFVLSSFILAFLVWPFGELKDAVAGMPGVPQDVMRILGWYWQRMAHGAPKNKLLQRWLEAWLAQDNSRGFMYRVHMSFAKAYKSLTGFSVATGLGTSRAVSDTSSRGVKLNRPSALWVETGNRLLNGSAISNALRAISRARLNVSSIDVAAARGASSDEGAGAAQRTGSDSAGGGGGARGANLVRHWRRAAAGTAGNQLQAEWDVSALADSAASASASAASATAAFATAAAAASNAPKDASYAPLGSPRTALGAGLSSPPGSMAFARGSQGGASGRLQTARVGSSGAPVGAPTVQHSASRRNTETEVALPHSLKEYADPGPHSDSSRLDVGASLPLPPMIQAPGSGRLELLSPTTARALLFPRDSVHGSSGGGGSGGGGGGGGGGILGSAASVGTIPESLISGGGAAALGGGDGGDGGDGGGISGLPVGGPRSEHDTARSRLTSPVSGGGAGSTVRGGGGDSRPLSPDAAATSSVDLGVLSSLLDRQDAKARLRNALTSSRLAALGRAAAGGGGATAQPLQSLREPDAAAMLADAVMANLLARFGRGAADLVSPTGGAASATAGSGSAGGSGSPAPSGRGGVLLAARGRSRPATSTGVASDGATAVVAAGAAVSKGARLHSAGSAAPVGPFSAACRADAAGEPTAGRTPRELRVMRRATFSFGSPRDPLAWAYRVPPPLSLARGSSGGHGGGGWRSSDVGLGAPGALAREGGGGGGPDEDGAGLADGEDEDREAEVAERIASSHSARSALQSFPMSSAMARLAPKAPNNPGGAASAASSRRRVNFAAVAAESGGRDRSSYGGQGLEPQPLELPARAPPQGPPPPPAAAAAATQSNAERKLQTTVSMPAATAGGHGRGRSRLADVSPRLAVSSKCGASAASRFSGVGSSGGGDGVGAGGAGGRGPLSLDTATVQPPPPPPPQQQQQQQSGLRVDVPRQLHSAGGSNPTSPGLAAAAAAAAMPFGGSSPRAAASLQPGGEGAVSGWLGRLDGRTEDEPAADGPVEGAPPPGRQKFGPVAEAMETHGSFSPLQKCAMDSKEAAVEALAAQAYPDADLSDRSCCPETTSARAAAEGGGAPHQQPKRESTDGIETVELAGDSLLSAPRSPLSVGRGASGGLHRGHAGYAALRAAVYALTAQLGAMQQQLTAALQEVQDMVGLLASLVAAAAAVPAAAPGRRSALRAAVYAALRAYVQEHPPAGGGHLLSGRHSVLEEAVLPLEPLELIPRAWTPQEFDPKRLSAAAAAAAPPDAPTADAGGTASPHRAALSFTVVREMSVSGAAATPRPSVAAAAARGGRAARRTRRHSSLFAPTGLGGSRPGSALHPPQVNARQAAAASGPRSRGASLARQQSLLGTHQPDWVALRRTLAASGSVAPGDTGDSEALLSALLAVAASSGGGGGGETPSEAAAHAVMPKGPPAAQRQQRSGWAGWGRAKAASEARWAEGVAAAAAAAPAPAGKELTLCDGSELGADLLPLQQEFGSHGASYLVTAGAASPASSAEPNGMGPGLHGMSRMQELQLLEDAAEAAEAAASRASSGNGASEGAAGPGAGVRVWNLAVQRAAEAAQRLTEEEQGKANGFEDVFKGT